jgi:hypothetical protein
MANISNFLENKLLDHVFKNTSYTSPTTVYVSLHSTPGPGDTGANELSTGGYARQPVTFDTAASGATANSGTVTYTNMPASTVTHFGVWDAATTGNFLWWGDVNPDVTFLAAENGIFNVGALDITLD